MRKFSKQQFLLWEWIFWQWIKSKMILRWCSDGNQGKYWWNMMKIRWLSYGLYSLKNCHKQFGQAFRPPPPFGQCPNLHGFFLGGASLSHFECQYFAKWIGNRYWALGLSFIWLGPVHAHSSGVKQAQVFELVFFCLRFILCSITSKYLDQPTAPFNLRQPRFFSNKWTLLYFEIVTTHWVVISNDIRTPQKIVTVILRVPTPPKRNVLFKFVHGL